MKKKREMEKLNIFYKKKKSNVLKNCTCHARCYVCNNKTVDKPCTSRQLFVAHALGRIFQ